MFKFTKHFSTLTTPQAQAIPGTDQVANSAGGFTWAVTDWVRLDRFLILGSEGGTYYIKEAALTVANAGAVQRCIAEDGVRVVNTIVAVATEAAPKADPAIFRAMCQAGDEATCKAATRCRRCAAPAPT
jgi:60 kDa SS-A/Ro ribonucleoprotein